MPPLFLHPMYARYRVVMYMAAAAMVPIQSARSLPAGVMVWVFSPCPLGALRMIRAELFMCCPFPDFFFLAGWASEALSVEWVPSRPTLHALACVRRA